MNGRVIIGVCTTIEMVCLTTLGAIALKRNRDAYKAEIKCINAEGELFRAKVDGIFKDVQIKILEKELAELKAKYEGNEEEA